MVDLTQPIAPKINLTPKESQLFAKLMDVCKECGLKTTLRVAGGWPRDKCLGKESDDIDIALDDIYGEDFAKLISSTINKTLEKG